MRMIANRPAAVAGGVLEELQADVAWRQRLRGDARADHERREERRAQKLGEQAARQRRRSRAAIVLH